jgi:hypothetical protein
MAVVIPTFSETHLPIGVRPLPDTKVVKAFDWQGF